MKQDEFRQRLIDGTIRVIAEYGLDKATTKNIGTLTQINEAYIYRCFGSKDELFARAFDMLDDELVSKAMEYIDVMYDHDLSYEERCRRYFNAMWAFLIGNKEKCLSFIRYYYSTYFKKLSAAGHKSRYIPLVNKFKDSFKPEADVWMILNHILNVMLAFAIMVHNDQMPKEDIYSEHVFRVIYHSIKQYFNSDKETDS